MAWNRAQTPTTRQAGRECLVGVLVAIAVPSSRCALLRECWVASAMNGPQPAFFQKLEQKDNPEMLTTRFSDCGARLAYEAGSLVWNFGAPGLYPGGVPFVMNGKSSGFATSTWPSRESS